MSRRSQTYEVNLIVVICLVLIFQSIKPSAFAESHVVHKLAEGTQGTWKKKWTWQQRWMKDWKPKTVYVAHWTKVWTPAEVNEYVPLPPIPPNWVKPTKPC